MRPFIILLAVLACSAEPVLAQVTIDLRALDALPKSGLGRPPAAPVAPRPRIGVTPSPSSVPPQTQANAPSATTPPGTTTTTTRATVAPSTNPPAATLPNAAPATVAIAPIPPPVVPAETAPATPPPISAASTAAAAPINAGLRVTFKGGDTDLSPDSASAIKELVGAVSQADSATYNVVAYATGKADDPSTARRLSLSRALAVRAALMADGIPSARIYVRALGSQTSDGPPDRVDVSIMGANTGTGASTAAPR